MAVIAYVPEGNSLPNKFHLKTFSTGQIKFLIDTKWWLEE